MISWVQAALLGLMSCCAASTIACLGTTVGNYTLNRPCLLYTSSAVRSVLWLSSITAIPHWAMCLRVLRF